MPIEITSKQIGLERKNVIDNAHLELFMSGVAFLLAKSKGIGFIHC